MSRAWISAFAAAGGGQVWLSAATVAKHAGSSEHWRVNDEGDLEIEVVTQQQGVPIVAVMGGLGAQGRGVWVIPAEGDEVLVAHPDGFEGDATIFAVLPTGGVPAGLTPDRVLVVGPQVHVVSGDVRIGPTPDAMVPLVNGVVLGSGIDTFTGATYGALGSVSLKVQADK